RAAHCPLPACAVRTLCGHCHRHARPRLYVNSNRASMTCGHSQTMKIGLEGLSWSGPVSDQRRVTLCCRERVTESDADVVAYSKLSSPWENTQSRLLLSLMSSESGFRGGREMEAIYPCVAGLDVHKQTVVACVRRLDSRGRVSKQVKTFGTMTRDLLELGDWLHRQGVTHVALRTIS